MKKHLPEIDTSYAELLQLPFQALKWEILKTAIELKVFDHLREAQTAEQLAVRMATHTQNTEHFLNTLTSLGYLSKKRGIFQNTPLADTFLANGGERFIGEFLLYVDQWNRPVFNGHMKTLIAEGPPPLEVNLEKEELWEHGARVTLNLNRCGRAKTIAQLVSDLPEFSSFSRMLDLGAGPGLIGVAVASLHSSLSCDLFDQAAVCKVADEVISEYGLEDRVRTVRGNYMEDSIGENFDFIMANFTLNFYRDRLDEIMEKVFRALNPNGVFMVVSDGLTHEKTEPAAMVLSWLPNALQGWDMAFEQGTIPRAMREAGFVSTHSEVIDDARFDAHGPINVIIGRKGS